ncbi:unnamed protein product [Sphagnum jensenii]|uniref:MGS-like domain-containing protein n=1 Tax=Sphagnum jensenii TaxID=128206 RepID=A0ABP1A5W8_9BRYO
MAMATPACHSLLARLSSSSSSSSACFFSPSRCCGSPLSAAIPSHSSSPLYPNFSSADEVLFGRRYQHQQLWSRIWKSRAMSAAADVSPAISATTVVSHQRLKQALISLSDKRDVDYLTKGLVDLGFKLISTGGTASALEQAGHEVTHVEQLTSFPEMLDGRVKTLHPAVHGGILAQRDMQPHMDALQQHGIGSIDVVVVNLYPFYSTVTAPGGTSFENGVENIDIGGPAMIRAAAKNHKDVLVVVDPADYPALLENLKREGDDYSFRRRLAWKAFQHVASYDSAVAEWFWKNASRHEFPPSLSIPLFLKSPLRYGENPHQRAAFYEDKSLAEVGAGGIATAVQYHGKEMSYNNYLDGDAAWNCVCEFANPTCVIVKHTNPCGVASVGPNTGLLEAYQLAVRADPVSAFGGIVAFNVEVDEALAREIREFRSPSDGETRMFYEIVIAPKYTEKGLQILKGKSKTLRILEAQPTKAGRRSLRQIGGGWLLQDSDDLTPDDLGFRVVTDKVPSLELVDDAQFAWLCCKHVKSNAIVVAKDNRMLVEDACKAGVKVIAQPGGSMRDQDAIDCCNKYGVAMVFTEVRHFRH